MLIVTIVILAFAFAGGYFIGVQNEGPPDGGYDGQLVVKSIEGKDEDEEDRVVLSMRFESEIDIDQIERKKQIVFQVVTE